MHVAGNDNDDSSSVEIICLPSGKFRASLPVASAFFSSVIGKKGVTKKRIETETKTKLEIPRPGAEGPIVVTGAARAGVASACARIRVVVESSRARQEFTHFISLPVKVRRPKNT